MKLNVNKFQELIKKATWNYLNQTVWLHFEEDRVKSKMVSEDSSAVLMLDLENDILPGADIVDLYFSNVAKNVRPYISLFESEEVNVDVKENLIKFQDDSQVMRIHFCSPATVRSFDGEKPSESMFFFNEPLSGIYEHLQKLKKVATRFNKLYVTTSEGKIYLETTDKQIPTCNSVKVELGNSEKEFDTKFHFKYINSLLGIINPDEYYFKFGYIEERDIGVMLFEKEDGSESYFITSSEDE